MSLYPIDEIEFMKIMWETPEFDVPKLSGLKIEFESFYKQHKKFESLLINNPEIRGLSVTDLPKYGITEEFFGEKRQQDSFFLACLQVYIDNCPLKEAVDFVNNYLNELEEVEINSTFESTVNVPPDRKPTDFEDAMLFRQYLKKNKKLLIEKVKTILLSKQRYFKSLNIQNSYDQEDGKLIQQLNTGKTPTTESSTIPTQPINEIKNNFDSTDIDVVYDHFKKGLVDKGKLSEEVLKLWLRAAFENQLPPKKLFRFNNIGIKKDIEKIFILYWHLVGTPYTHRTRYIELLSNYFEGFDTKRLKNNWKLP